MLDEPHTSQDGSFETPDQVRLFSQIASSVVQLRGYILRVERYQPVEAQHLTESALGELDLVTKAVDALIENYRKQGLVRGTGRESQADPDKGAHPHSKRRRSASIRQAWEAIEVLPDGQLRSRKPAPVGIDMSAPDMSDLAPETPLELWLVELLKRARRRMKLSEIKGYVDTAKKQIPGKQGQELANLIAVMKKGASAYIEANGKKAFNPQHGYYQILVDTDTSEPKSLSSGHD